MVFIHSHIISIILSDFLLYQFKPALSLRNQLAGYTKGYGARRPAPLDISTLYCSTVQCDKLPFLPFSHLCQITSTVAYLFTEVEYTVKYWPLCHLCQITFQIMVGDRILTHPGQFLTPGNHTSWPGLHIIS